MIQEQDTAGGADRVFSPAGLAEGTTFSKDYSNILIHFYYGNTTLGAAACPN
jgi:hypothetical protein